MYRRLPMKQRALRLMLLFTSSARRGRAKAGLILNGIVIFVAIWRLGLGGGLI